MLSTIAHLLHSLLNMILADLTCMRQPMTSYILVQTSANVHNMVHGYILLLTLHLRVYYCTVVLFGVTSPEQLPISI